MSKLTLRMMMVLKKNILVKMEISGLPVIAQTMKNRFVKIKLPII